ncbi:peptidyl-prolyl cis-trans isomerase [Arenimonas caeni]|uniref:Periplasmic chaperone PpiD n=1 Tax=Arenimonas caeni TaxID=2058085 RepID=A0A2P6MC57_9GAMM|nr:peptidyl-prolyl cis-trans isomerase [Arenimonas caeni]PRH83598.1 peptidylprolyl isomerase [Arenimonas caeni]
MLQRIRDKSSGWMAFTVLGLVIVTMAFFGIESYFAPKIETYSAKIQGPAKFWIWGKTSREIGQDQFQRRFEQVRQLERARQGDAFDPLAFESADNRRRVLDEMIDEEVLALFAEREGITIGEAEVAAELKQMDEFQVNGAYSADQYRLGLAARGMSHGQFIASVRADMASRLVPTQILATGLATDAELDEFLRLSRQVRDLALIDLPTPSAPEAPDDAALQAWYEANAARYRSPEQVAIEYVEIDASLLDVPTVVDEQTLRARYEEQRGRYVTDPVRTAAHILVAAPANADAATDQAARERAEALAEQARAPGADFAALAREHSEDLGSKADGGLLGPIEPGLFEGPFQDALFALDQPGQVAGPVRTPDGWHVIQLADITAGSGRSFEEVRGEIEAEYLATERDRRFSDLSNTLIERIYRDPTSLAPAAEATGLEVKRTALFERGNGEGIAAIPEVRAAAFADNQRIERQVSDAVEIGPGQVVVLQVVEVVPEAQIPLEQVRERVRAELVADTLSKASEAQAEALLERARAGESFEVLASEVGRTVAELPGITRQAPVPPALIDEAFRLPVPGGDAPSVGMVRLGPDRHALVQVLKVSDGELEGLDEATRDQLLGQVAQARAVVEREAFVRALRRQFTVTVAEDRL